MKNATPYRKYLLICLLIGLGWVNLSATQAFWSMEPSTREIERADSLTGFDISKYVINIAINDVNPFIEGSVEAFVTAEENLSGIDYRLMGGSLNVSEVWVNGIISPYTFVDGLIHIPLSVNAGADFTTKVFYSGVPGLSPAPYNIGLRFTPNGIYTLSNPDAGRYWWPSYDHPWDKALVDWQIRVRSDWLAAANGLRTGITDHGDGTRTHHWVSSFPIATYVIGFAAGPYIEFTQTAGDLPIQNFVLSGQLNNAMTDFANVPEMISYFSSAFGDYPFEKYGHVVVNMATYAAMEHQTMTTFGAAYLNGQQTYESIVAHELAHQWYGNLVTPITMREVWLKESFATYSEALWVNHKDGWDAACTYLRNSIQQYYITWENSNGPHTIFNPEYNLMFAPPTYEKSASVLHMLRLKMGNEDFFSFIRALITNYYNSNLNTAEFIALAEQISGMDLTQFFLQWIYSPGIPNARFSVFKNQQNMAKIWAQSISPTQTLFDLDIPISIPGSAVADSVVIRATAEGFVNYFGIGATDDLQTLQIDPHNWVLARQLNLENLQLSSCLAYDSAVALTWNAMSEDIPVLGYNVMRRELPDGDFVQINTQVITELAYTDTSVTNGISYEYRISAIDTEGYISLPSNVLSATPIDFPFDLGILVIDETRDGSGSPISPTDQMVDDFYSYVLDGWDFTAWDYTMEGAPLLSDLSRYSMILWHGDDFSDLQLMHNLDTLGSYILSGGKLILSGWKHPSVFSPDWKAQFLPGIELVYHNSAVLISAQSDSYADLYPDPAKLNAVWDGMIPMSYTFSGTQNILARAEMLNEGSGHNEACVVKSENNGTLILFGFPLYFMQADGVRAFITELISVPNPDIEDGESIPAPPVLTCYPNPFNRDSGISIRMKNAIPQRIDFYNIRGEKVISLSKPLLWQKGDKQQIHLSADILKGLNSGCYIIRVKTDRGTLVKKTLFFN